MSLIVETEIQTIDVPNPMLGDAPELEGIEDGEPKAREKSPCFTKETKDGKCKSASETNSQLAKNGGFDSNPLSSEANLVGQVADGVNNTDSISKGTLKDAQELSNRNGAIRKRVNDLRNRLNEKRKDEGKKPIDFDARKNDMLAKIRNSVKEGLKENDMNVKDTLATLDLEDPNEKEEEKAEEKVAKKEKSAGEAVDLGSGEDKKKEEKEPKKFDLGLEEEEMIAEEQKAADRLAGLEEDEELVYDDISQKKGTSIFQIISVRYLKSGMERLSEKKDNDK